MMPHCRLGAMWVSQTNFLDHVGKGAGYFGTFFDAILMTPPRQQNEDLRHVMAAWDCLTPGGTLVAVVSPGWERPTNETELLLFRRWFATVQARQEELPEDTFTESAPPMQSGLILGSAGTAHPMSFQAGSLSIAFAGCRSVECVLVQPLARQGRAMSAPPCNPITQTDPNDQRKNR
jgi:hypothetical protein